MSRQPTIAQDELWRLFDLSFPVKDGSLVGYLQKMLDGCVALFNAAGASVFLREEATDLYVLAAQSGIDSRIPMGASIRAGHGIAGTCIITGQPMLIVDPQRHPLLRGKVANRRRDAGSSLVLPLMPHGGDCVGVLNLTRSPQEPPFAAEDSQVAGGLARHVALAVNNARLLAAKDAATLEASLTRDKLRSIISCLGVGVIAVDAEKQITDWNPEAQDMLEGYRLGDSFQPSAKPDCGPLCQALEAALDQGLSGERAQSRAFDADEDLSWSIVSAPLEGGGATAVVQDFTEHDRATREMARLKRLAEIGQMTAAIAHEIRNPLTGISGAAQMIACNDGDAAEFGKIIKEEADKLNLLCNEFLDFAKPLSLRRDTFSLRLALENVVRQHRPAASGAGIDLLLQSASDEETVVVADLTRIEQVAHNLVLNALQACRKGDRVTVVVGRDGFSVRDTGVGMEPGVAEKLFTPFFTTKAQGTGLGLSNARKIVDAHGGRIAVSSEPGHGTTFEVELDVRRIA